ncbi:MAG TPA: BON domain-containing protein [Acidimicrobiia bacterium]
MRQFFRRFIPISGSAIALWAWRNRDEVLEWTGFGVRAAQKLAAGDSADVKTEARVRASLNRDRRTRYAPGLRIEVLDGVVVLRGVIDEGVGDVAVAIAERTTGVERVDHDGLHEVHPRRSRD